MALRVRVCNRDEVPPGTCHAFSVQGVDWPILVANVGGTLLATTSRCPHEDVSLEGGARRGTTITCPGHGYVFDLATGACAHDPQLRLRRYRVSIDGDELFVDLL
jgi:nitrite reductase/ring-hydroxylating ferredoxin subunit